MQRFVLSALVFVCILVAPAMGISVSCSSGGGGGSGSSSVSYHLDDSTSLKENTRLLDNGLYQYRQAYGSGKNRIEQQLSGNGNQGGSVIDSAGQFSTENSAAALGDGVVLSQALTGSGDLNAELYASSGQKASGQEADVVDGVLSTSQSLAAFGDVYTGQDTALAGQSGSISSVSSSQANLMALGGGFSEEGDLSAKLMASASSRAVMDGEVSLMGVPCLDSDNLQTVASGDIAMEVEGLYAKPSGNLGTFGLGVQNVVKEPKSATMYQLPEYTADGGRKEAYVLAGWRWNQKDPQIKLYLKDDSNLRNERLSATSVKNAVAAAANTWDAATNQNLFSDSGVTVTTSSRIKADTYDGKNVHAWKYLTSAPSALAYSRTWYSLNKVGGYYSALESDVSYNTRYGWSTSGSNYDVQTVALHELGHTIGLGDLYGRPEFSADTRQIMHYYTGVKRTLGNGDKTGAWILYG